MLAEDIFSQDTDKDEKRRARRAAIDQLVQGKWNPENNDTGIFVEKAQFDKGTLDALRKDENVGEDRYIAAFIRENLEERNLKNVEASDWQQGLLFASIKKHPSGGRLRRIKEYTQKFWEDCQEHFLSHSALWSKEHDLWRTKRLRLSPDQTLKDNLKGSNFSAFDMQVGRKKLAVVFDGKYLLSIDNLEREFRQDFPRDFSFEQLLAQLRRQLSLPVRLERTDRDGDQQQRRDSAGNIVSVDEDGRNYIPIIPSCCIRLFCNSLLQPSASLLWSNTSNSSTRNISVRSATAFLCTSA